jgi:hypothetical protein
MKPLGKTLCLAAVLATTIGAWAQTALAAAAPASPPAAAIAPNPVVLGQPSLPTAATPFAPVPPNAAENADLAEAIILGQSALGNGLASLAVEYFQSALAKPGLDQNTRDTLNLSLATAYLAQADAASAAAALQAVSATNTPAYLLRDTLLKERDPNWDVASTELARIDAASLAAVDQPWYFMALANLAEHNNDLAAANTDWTQAIATAATALQKAQFEAAQWRTQILLDSAATPDAAAKLEQSLKDPNLDSTLGAKLSRLLAIVYEKQGRRADALALLRNKLMLVDLDRESLDALRLEYVLLDQETPATANAADDQAKLRNILDDWPDKDAPDYDNLLQWQEMALAILQSGLADKAGAQPDELAQLKSYIDEKAADPRGHPLLKQLYLLQTQLDIALQKYPEAATAAQHLLDLPSGPGRDLAREGAWRTLAFVAWSATPRKYREAASNLLSLHKALPDDLENKTVTALLADLYFLNGETEGDPDDYLNAAAYYASLLPSPPLTVERGTLLVRAVESQLKANKLDDAITLLDQSVANYDIQPMDRWSAEFNVLMALRDHGRSADAFKRLGQLLDPEHGLDNLPVALRLRLRWLDATLAVEETDPSAAGKAKVLTDEARAAENNLPKSELDARELAANGLLLEMQAAAQNALPGPEQTFYSALEASYLDTDAAVLAQLIIADELAAQNKFADAQSLTEKVANQFEDVEVPVNQAPPGAEYAPFARYESALYAEHLDSTGQYADARGILKQFVEASAKNPLYATSSLIYSVRFEQGNLEMMRNDFQAALGYFNDLLERLKDRPLNDDLVSGTLMARALCLVDLASEPGDDVAEKRKEAIEELEGLLNKSELPVADRVHAGAMLGGLLEADEAGTAEAAKTYYLVIQDFLLGDPALGQALDRDPHGRFYMADCIISLGKLEEKLNHVDEARRLYQLVIANNLGSSEYAKSLISALRPTPDSTPAIPPAPPPAPAPAPAAAAGTAATGGNATVN